MLETTNGLQSSTFCIIEIQGIHKFHSFKFQTSVVLNLAAFFNSQLQLRTFQEKLYHCIITPVAYPEGFRRRYTGLGAQTMCPNY